jgi:uncharacterized ferredoxin-like protein
MALAARTAPKAVGIDSLTIEVVPKKEIGSIAEEMIRIASETGMEFFRVNAGQLKESEALVLIGVAGQEPLGLNCGGCGYPSCDGMAKACKATASRKTDYPGPNCIFKVTYLGIAVGSEVKTASMHNADNRVMYTAGLAAMNLGLLEGCSVAYGIPLKSSGRNIFFAGPVEH